MKWFPVLIIACVLDVGVSTEAQRGLMFLSPSLGELGLSEKRAADDVERRNANLRSAKALSSQNRFVAKRVVGTSTSGRAQPPVTIRIAGNSNRYLL